MSVFGLDILSNANPAAHGLMPLGSDVMLSMLGIKRII